MKYLIDVTKNRRNNSPMNLFILNKFNYFFGYYSYNNMIQHRVDNFAFRDRYREVHIYIYKGVMLHYGGFALIRKENNEAQYAIDDYFVDYDEWQKIRIEREGKIMQEYIKDFII